MKCDSITGKRRLGVLGVIMGLTLGLMGCASHVELPPQATQDLLTLRDQLVKGKAHIQLTCNSARDLTQRPQAQLDPQIARLIQAIAAMDDLATDHRKQFSSAEDHAQAYFAHWQRQMEGMSASLAEKGESRRAQSMASFGELKARTESLRQEFRPYMTSLLEVSKYLQTDTTAAGVKTVTPQIITALDREKPLMSKADAVIAQIDAMRGGK